MHHQVRGHSDQNDGGRQETDVDGVGELVIGPHAARDLAHRRAGEGVGLPVGGEPLHAVKGVADDPPHGDGRQRYPESVGHLAKDIEPERDADKGGKRGIGRADLGAPFAERDVRQRVDQPACEEWQEDVAERRQGHREECAAEQPANLQPVTADKSRGVAETEFVLHGFVRAAPQFVLRSSLLIF